MKRVLVILVAIVATGCAQIKVQKVDRSSGPTTAVGLLVPLPLTVVRLNVKVDHLTFEDGRYAEFRKVFAPDAEPLCALRDKGMSCESYIVQDTGTISFYGRADPENLYMVTFLNGGFLADQTMTLSWTDTGIVSGAAASASNRSVDVAISAVKLATSLGTKFAAGGTAFSGETEKNKCEFDPPAKGAKPQSRIPNDAWVIAVLKEYVKGEATSIVEASYCSLPDADRAKITDRKKFQQAAAFYSSRVASVNATRDSYLSGQLQAVDLAGTLARLDVEIDKVVNAAFVGTKKTKTWDITVDVKADRLKIGTIEVLRWHPDLGACLGADVVEAPASAAMPNQFVEDGFSCSPADRNSSSFKTVVLGLGFSPAAEEQLFSRVKDVDDGGDRSFRYRIPAQVVGTLKTDEKTLAASQFAIAQLGTIISLPAKRSTKSLTYDLGYVEATGALKSFKLVTSGAADASGSIDAAGATAATVLDARSAARTARSESTQEEALYKDLKLRDDICTLQTKLGLQCTTPPR